MTEWSLWQVPKLSEKGPTQTLGQLGQLERGIHGDRCAAGNPGALGALCRRQPLHWLLPLCNSFRWESLVSQAADIGQALLLCGGPWGRRTRALPNETYYTDVCQINAKDHKAIAMEF